MTEYWVVQIKPHIFLFTFQWHRVSCWTDSKAGPGLCQWNNEVTVFRCNRFPWSHNQMYASKVLVKKIYLMFGITIAVTNMNFNRCDCPSASYSKCCSCTSFHCLKYKSIHVESTCSGSICIRRERLSPKYPQMSAYRWWCRILPLYLLE